MATPEEFFGEGGVIEAQPPIAYEGQASEEITPAEEPLETPAQNMTPKEFFGKDEVKIYESEDEEERLNFAQRFGKDIEKRANVDREIKAAYEEGEIGMPEALLQTIGKTGFGSVHDFLGEVIVSAGRGLSAITPDVIEKPLIEGATSAGLMFLNTPIAMTGLLAVTRDVLKLGAVTAKEGPKEWAEFKKENPRAARNIEATVNIALLLAPVKGVTKVKAPTFVGTAAVKLEKKAATQIATKRSDFVEDLVTPKQTAKVKKEQVARTVEEGVLKTKKVIPSASEKQMAAEVIKIPGIKTSETLQGNYNAISKKVREIADSLKTTLEKNDVVFPRKEFNAKLKNIIDKLEDHPLLVGDAQKVAVGLIKKMRKIVDGKKSTASNLLAARKEFDFWIKSQKGTDIFDPNLENALSMAIREVRIATNDFIQAKAKTMGVKDSLKKQSTLLRAMDNIEPKAAAVSSNIIKQAWGNVSKVIGLKGEFSQTLAVLYGIGGLGAASKFAPFFTKIVLATGVVYIAGKAVMSPQAKKAMALLLKGLDKAIIKAKDKQVISQLRLDREALLMLLEGSKENLEGKDDESNKSKP